MQAKTGEVKHIGQERMYTAVSPSPDGRYLLVAYLVRGERGVSAAVSGMGSVFAAVSLFGVCMPALLWIACRAQRTYAQSSNTLKCVSAPAFCWDALHRRQPRCCIKRTAL